MHRAGLVLLRPPTLEPVPLDHLRVRRPRYDLAEGLEIGGERAALDLVLGLGADFDVFLLPGQASPLHAQLYCALVGSRLHRLHRLVAIRSIDTQVVALALDECHNAGNSRRDTAADSGQKDSWAGVCPLDLNGRMAHLCFSGVVVDCASPRSNCLRRHLRRSSWSTVLPTPIAPHFWTDMPMILCSFVKCGKKFKPINRYGFLSTTIRSMPLGGCFTLGRAAGSCTMQPS